MSNMFVWDGNPSKLPPKGQLFFYKERKFYWKECDCRCGRPKAYDENGKFNFEMEIRLRGKDQGFPVFNVLVKLGKMEELIQIGQDDVSGIALLLQNTVKEYVKSFDPNESKHFLRSKGISEIEFEDAMHIAAAIFVAEKVGNRDWVLGQLLRRLARAFMSGFVMAILFGIAGFFLQSTFKTSTQQILLASAASGLAHAVTLFVLPRLFLKGKIDSRTTVILPGVIPLVIWTLGLIFMPR